MLLLIQPCPGQSSEHRGDAAGKLQQPRFLHLSQLLASFPGSLYLFPAPYIFSQIPASFPISLHFFPGSLHFCQLCISRPTSSLHLSPPPCIFLHLPTFSSGSACIFPQLCIFPRLPAYFPSSLHFFPDPCIFPPSSLHLSPAPCIFPLLPACFPCSQHVSPVPLIFPLLPASFPTSLHLSPSQQPGTIQIPAPSPPSLPRAGAEAPGSACHLCCPACPSHLCPSGTWLRELLTPCTRLLQSQHEAMLDFFFFFFCSSPVLTNPVCG